MRASLSVAILSKRIEFPDVVLLFSVQFQKSLSLITSFWNVAGDVYCEDEKTTPKTDRTMYQPIATRIL